MARDNGYDSSKDEMVESFIKKTTEAGNKIRVAAFSYDNGPIKIAVQRGTEKKGEVAYYNAGRMTGEETAIVLKGLKRAMAWYEKHGEEKKGSKKRKGSDED